MSDAPAAERTVPIFDGHNDLLARALEEPMLDFVTAAHTRHLSLEKCRAGGYAGALFALFVPPDKREQRRSRKTPGGGELPGAVPLERAQRVVAREFARLRALCAQSDMRIVSTVGEIESCIEAGTIAAVPHLEGAEPIDRELEMLELYHAAGIRSIGPVWSRHNRFARGVPPVHGRTAEIGGGLTAAGRRLVKRCEQLGICVDVSHLNARGFRDLAAATDMPIVATHSNAWELCRNARNLSDEQLAVIKASDGFVGINFGTLFLREDGAGNEETPLSRIVEQLRYVSDRIGVERVGFGSDFDGTVVPKALNGAGGMQQLLKELRNGGFSEEEVECIARKNWLSLLRRVWGA